MAVLPQFQDPGPPAYANAFFGGMSQGTSIVERKQKMRLAADDQQLQQAKFIAHLPLLQAQTLNEQLSAAAALQTATDRVRWKSKFAVESVAANRKFQDILSEKVDNVSNQELEDTPENRAFLENQTKLDTQATYEARSAKLRALAAEYAWMGELPEGKGYVAAVDKAAADTTTAAGLNAQVDRYLAVANINQQGRRDAENIKAAAKGSSAETYTASRERIAALQSNTKLTLQERNAQIAAERKGATVENLLQRAAEADLAAAEASAAHDEVAAKAHRQTASNYRDLVQKETTYAGQAPLAVPEKSPPLRPKPRPVDTSPPAEVSITIPGSDEAPSNAPLANPPEEAAVSKTNVAPTHIPPTATKVVIGGKEYQIFKDKNGKRAYKIDGNWVPIDTQ